VPIFTNTAYSTCPSMIRRQYNALRDKYKAKMRAETKETQNGKRGVYYCKESNWSY